jgi:hypothetical protein
VRVAVGVSEGVGLDVREAVGVADGVRVGVTDGVCVGVCVGDEVAVGRLRVEVADGMGTAVPVAIDTRCAVCAIFAGCAPEEGTQAPSATTKIPQNSPLFESTEALSLPRW